MSLSDVVNVTIDRETAAVAQESFDVIAVLSSEINSHNSIEFVNSLSSAADFIIGGAGGQTYKAIEAIFQQNPRCKQVGLIQLKSVINCPYTGATTTGDVITVVVNGNSYSATHATDADTTLAALIVTINAGEAYVVSSKAGGVLTFNSTDTLKNMSVIVDISAVTGTFAMHVARTVDIVFSSADWTAAGSIIVNINGTSTTQAFSSSIATTLGLLGTALVAAHPSLIADFVWTASTFRFSLLLVANQEIFVRGVTLSGITGAMVYVKTDNPTDIGSDTVTTVLDYVKNSNNSWYGLIYTPYNLYDHVTSAYEVTALADMKRVVNWAEANNKICGVSDSLPASITSTVTADSTSMIAYIKNLAYARSFVAFNEYASMSSGSIEAIAAAALGRIFPWTPGSYTTKFKKLTGITPSSLTATQQVNADAKYLNTYITMGGNNMFQQGKVGEGEWIDTIIFADWIRSLIETNVFSALINAKKIPFDDQGLGVLGAKTAAALESGISSGGFTPHARDASGNVTGGYVVIIPKASSFSANDKNTRIIPASNPIEFIGYLAGAIHSATISGKITV